jgi:hypothetical protein
MPFSEFDVFEGVFPDKDLIWIQSLNNSKTACEFMFRLAAHNPERSYFTINILTHELVASVPANKPQ